MDFDPSDLSKEIAAAHEQVARWDAAALRYLDDDAVTAAIDPFLGLRRASTQSTLLAVAPLGEGFTAHVRELTVRRLLLPYDRLVASALTDDPNLEPDAASPSKASRAACVSFSQRAQLLLSDLTKRSDVRTFSNEALRIFQSLRRSQERAQSPRRDREFARQEVEMRLQVAEQKAAEEAKPKELPKPQGSKAQEPELSPEHAAPAAAERLLAETAGPLFDWLKEERLFRGDETQAMLLMRLELGLEAAHEGFPSRLSARTLAEWFGPLADPRMDPSGGSPAARRLLGSAVATIAPASLLRALGAFGAALAATVRESPTQWVQRGDAIARLAHEWRALFVLQGCTATFHRRPLGASIAAANNAERILTRCMLLRARRMATGVLAREVALGRFDAAKLCYLAYGVECIELVPWLASDHGASARFCGLLRGAERMAEMRVLFDEDWHRNPRAREYFVAAPPSLPPRTVASAEAFSRFLLQTWL
jgi:hypothetical protein